MKPLKIKEDKNEVLLKKLSPKYRSKIAFSTQEGIHIIATGEILFLKALGNYTEINLHHGKKILISKTLKVVEQHLDKNSFKRCHQSYIVNMNEVIMLNEIIILSDTSEIPVSRRKRNEFKNWFMDKVTFV